MALGQAAKPWRGISQWVDAVAGLHDRIAHRFARSEARERSRRYLVGLLERVERGGVCSGTRRAWTRRMPAGDAAADHQACGIDRGPLSLMVSCEAGYDSPRISRRSHDSPVEAGRAGGR